MQAPTRCLVSDSCGLFDTQIVWLPISYLLSLLPLSSPLPLPLPRSLPIHLHLLPLAVLVLSLVVLVVAVPPTTHSALLLGAAITAKRIFQPGRTLLAFLVVVAVLTPGRLGAALVRLLVPIL
jgi:hypothetical protein